MPLVLICGKLDVEAGMPRGTASVCPLRYPSETKATVAATVALGGVDMDAIAYIFAATVEDDLSLICIVF